VRFKEEGKQGGNEPAAALCFPFQRERKIRVENMQILKGKGKITAV
jgi:hypothetical protein